MAAEDDSLNAEDERILRTIRKSLATSDPATTGAVQASDARSEHRRRVSASHAQLEASYHQVRVLRLIASFTGNGGVLEGLTKLAKLDFLLRYPQFLARLADSRAVPTLALPTELGPTESERSAVESRMIRYKYGPWDDRYYAIVGALVGRGLVEYVPDRRHLTLRVTPGGKAMAQSIALDPAWQLTARRCEVLRAAFARMTGNRLKQLIYDQLPDVVNRPHRSVI